MVESLRLEKTFEITKFKDMNDIINYPADNPVDPGQFVVVSLGDTKGQTLPN